MKKPCRNLHQDQLCPCFISSSDEDKEITCRDLFYDPKDAVNIMKYRSKDKYQNQKDAYCHGGCFKMCEHYISYLHFQWTNDSE